MNHWLRGTPHGLCAGRVHAVVGLAIHSLCRIVTRMLLFFSLLLLMGGCGSVGQMSTGHRLLDNLVYGPLLGNVVSDAAQGEREIAAGLRPPGPVYRRCQYAGTVRDSEGRWAQDQTIIRACLADAGFERQP